MSRSVLAPYFVNLRNMEKLAIYEKSLSDFIIDMGWKNVFVIKERYYENLVKVFYSNMAIFSQITNRIVTSVEEIHIEFDVADLN